MRNNVKHHLLTGVLLLLLFALFTAMVLRVDVQPAGETETPVGFAALNGGFHELTGTHWMLYTVTDWLGLVPVLVCLVFGGLGFVQLIRRKSLVRVDADILLLGVYYVLVFALYLIFEMFPVNYRPVLIGDCMEASYPSSTTLLTLSVMPTLAFQACRRMKRVRMRQILCGCSGGFALLMALGRLLSGVHWLTDIVGAALLSAGLFEMYRAMALLCSGQEQRREV